MAAFVVTILAGSMWFADRLLRFVRWIYYGAGNYCTITPLPGDITNVTMHRSVKAHPGSYAFLWIPGVRLFEGHPFTLAGTEPVQFAIKAQDGFTRDLYLAACKQPGRKLRAAIEGPYGQIPDAHEYDRTVLFAGGSGATFAFAVALDWSRKGRPSGDKSHFDLVWTVKSEGEYESPRRRHRPR